MQDRGTPMSPMSPMDSAALVTRPAHNSTLLHTASMERRGSSLSMLQQRVVAEKKWALGLQVRNYP